MRRSAAPSSLPDHKRRRFQTPFISAASKSYSPKLNSTNSGEEKEPDNSDGRNGISTQQKLQEMLKSIRKVPYETGECTTSAGVSGEDTRLMPTTSTISQPSITSSSATPTFLPTATATSLPTATPTSLPTATPTSLPTATAVGHPVTTPSGMTRMGSTSRNPSYTSSSHGYVDREDGVESQTTDGGRGSVAENSTAKNALYYSVMWCKRSARKHKVWEGDAVLVVEGRSVVLKDMEGKDIGRGVGYKRSELSDLSDGSTLVVGAKEVEIMGVVEECDYHSGKCFSGTGGTSEIIDTPLSTVSTVKKLGGGVQKPRPFQRLVSGSRHSLNTPCTNVEVTSKFDPNTPGALVMPRPGQKHQLENNVKCLPLVDVVVDPHVSSHLRPHQRKGVVFLYQCVMGMKEYSGKGAILADEMGLGKTLQCISLIWTLLKQGPYGGKPVVKKVLVITPGSLVKNWDNEFRKWLGTERLKVFCVSAENKPEDFALSPLYPVMVISYEMFVRSVEVLSKSKFDLVICDEGHRLKNSGTKTNLSICSLSTRKRILLTGTPIQNDLQEFYALVDLCNPGILGSQAAFHRVYESPISVARQPGASDEDKDMGTHRAEELKRLTSMFCLRRTQEVINQYLPPKVENVLFCRMSGLQVSLYKHLLNSALVKSCLHARASMLGAEPQSSSTHQTPPHLVCISALKKLCNDPSLVYDAAKLKEESRPVAVGDEEEDASMTELFFSEVLSIFPSGYDPLSAGTSHSGKLEVLFDMIHQLFTTTSEKIVLVSNYTQTLDLLARLCDDHGYKVLRLDGSTPSSKRQGIVDQFNSRHGRERVFLLSTKAGGVGLNLIGASRLVLFDIDWNPANDLQAMARVWRDGQKKKVHIYRLLTTGSIEEKIFQRQVTKQGLNTVMDFRGGVAPGSGLICDCLRPPKRKWEVSFSREELKDLFSLREDTLCDTHDLLACGCGLNNNEDGRTMPTSQNTKHGDMDELMQWTHHTHPLDQSLIQDFLMTGPAAGGITFLLQNQSE